MGIKKVIVKKQASEKIKALFPWVYRNEIKKVPKDVSPGEIVDIYSSEEEFLGRGYINLNSVIAIRLFSFFKRENIDKDFIKRRIEKAYKKREKIRSLSNAYRLIHSEGDFLPGLIVDVYKDYLSVQINTAGMENLREYILDVLIDICSPKGIYEKSDQKARKKEGLRTEEKVLYGSIEDEIIIRENNIFFSINLKKSQKTGFYLDQRRNREIVSSYLKENFSVLDLFSNTGGFGIYAGKKGAQFIKFVDISENAVNLIEKNCTLNSINSYEIVKEDVFDFLKKEVEKGIKYDLIIVDPPPFAKTKKEKQGALRGYKYLLINSLKLLSEEGYLAVFSCSHHIGMEDLKSLVLEVSKKEKTPIEIVEHLYQDTDHPFILNIPNSLYLTGILWKKA